MEKCCIDLGEAGPTTCGCPEPCSDSKASKPYYPSIYFDVPESLDLPDSGQLLITFKRRSQTDAITDGKTRRSVSLDVLSIDGVEGGEAPNKKLTPSEDFDARMKAHLAGEDEEGE